MTTVVVTPTAEQDLENLITSHSLPIDTIERFKRSVAALETFPLIGANLEGRWTRYRFVLGPWRWMLILYIFDEALDRVAIVTVHDGRTNRAATGTR
jgi:plasmid stabilization system protein ParE